MAIFLIRHGETASNATRRVQTPDIPLNERGLEQARLLAGRLERLGVSRVVSSDHTRAAMTASAIAERAGVELEWDEGLRERNFGALRGQTYAEIGHDLFHRDFHPPEGESWASFDARVDATWERVARTSAELPGNTAVITHGLFCRSLVDRRLDLSQGWEPVAAFGNTSLTIVGAAPPWVVELLNCCEHLAEGAAAPSAGLRV